MTEDERTHGRCAYCKERFRLEERYVAYGGLMWCSIDHLAEWTVEHDDSPFRSSVEEIAEGYEVRNA